MAEGNDSDLFQFSKNMLSILKNNRRFCRYKKEPFVSTFIFLIVQWCQWVHTVFKKTHRNWNFQLIFKPLKQKLQI